MTVNGNVAASIDIGNTAIQHLQQFLLRVGVQQDNIAVHIGSTHYIEETGTHIGTIFDGQRTSAAYDRNTAGQSRSTLENSIAVQVGLTDRKSTRQREGVIRKDITANPDAFLKLIKKTEKATGVPITAEMYKRPKEAPSEELAPYFAWKGQIGCTRSEEFSDATFGPELADRVLDFFEKLIPLYDYFNKFKV